MFLSIGLPSDIEAMDHVCESAHQSRDPSRIVQSKQGENYERLVK
jgi:hypothetical protein